jgi:hypothetical protein
MVLRPTFEGVRDPGHALPNSLAWRWRLAAAELTNRVIALPYRAVPVILSSLAPLERRHTFPDLRRAGPVSRPRVRDRVLSTRTEIPAYFEAAPTALLGDRSEKYVKIIVRVLGPVRTRILVANLWINPYKTLRNTMP